MLQTRGPRAQAEAPRGQAGQAPQLCWVSGCVRGRIELGQTSSNSACSRCGEPFGSALGSDRRRLRVTVTCSVDRHLFVDHLSSQVPTGLHVFLSRSVVVYSFLFAVGFQRSTSWFMFACESTHPLALTHPTLDPSCFQGDKHSWTQLGHALVPISDEGV